MSENARADRTHRWDLVIFDCDGVLVDSEPVSNGLLAKILNEAGLPISVEETARTFTGHSNEACVSLAERMLGRSLPESFLDDFLRRELQALSEDLRPIPGVVDALRRISFPVCVASSGLPEKILASLTATDLLAFFDGRIFSVVDVPNPKPAPDIYLHAAHQMGAMPARCAVIEDSPTGAPAG